MLSRGKGQGTTEVSEKCEITTELLVVILAEASPFPVFSLRHLALKWCSCVHSCLEFSGMITKFVVLSKHGIFKNMREGLLFGVLIF